MLGLKLIHVSKSGPRREASSCCFHSCQYWPLTPQSIIQMTSQHWQAITWTSDDPVYWHIYIYDMPPSIPILWTIFVAEKNVSISFLKWFRFFSFLTESSLMNWLVITGIGKNMIDINISLFISIKALPIFILFLNNNIFRSISMKYLFP